LAEKGIESRKASGRLKVEHPFLIVKRHFDPLKEALLGDREELLYAQVCLALANLAMCIFCRQAA